MTLPSVTLRTPGILGDGGSVGVDVSTLLLLAGGFLGWAAFRRLKTERLAKLPLAGAWLVAGLALAAVALAFVLPPLISPAPGSARPSSPARLAIEAPVNGQVFSGTADHPAAVAVRIGLTGARIVPFTSTTVRPDEGHIHLFLDGALVSMTTGTEAGLVVPPGVHVLRAEFVAADHLPFDPRVEASVTFTVRG